MLDRPRNPLGEIQPEPGRADENQQRHHQEQREVDALERPLQHAELAVVLIRFGDAPGVPRQIAGQEVAGNDDADWRSVGVARDGAGAYQLAAGIERFVRLRIGAAGRHPGCQQIRGRSYMPSRQCR